MCSLLVWNLLEVIEKPGKHLELCRVLLGCCWKLGEPERCQHFSLRGGLPGDQHRSVGMLVVMAIHPQLLLLDNNRLECRVNARKISLTSHDFCFSGDKIWDIGIT